MRELNNLRSLSQHKGQRDKLAIHTNHHLGGWLAQLLAHWTANWWAQFHSTSCWVSGVYLEQLFWSPITSLFCQFPHNSCKYENYQNFFIYFCILVYLSWLMFSMTICLVAPQQNVMLPVCLFKRHTDSKLTAFISTLGTPLGYTNTVHLILRELICYLTNGVHVLLFWN